MELLCLFDDPHDIQGFAVQAMGADRGAVRERDSERERERGREREREGERGREI